VITVTFTLGDNTRAASMIATVHETHDADREIEGVYDVTAVIRDPDGGRRVLVKLPS